MCIRDRHPPDAGGMAQQGKPEVRGDRAARGPVRQARVGGCLLYTSDAADERSSVDLGGRRIIKEKQFY